MSTQRSGMIVKKVGMTTLFLDSGEACPVTLFSLEGCTVVAVKKSEDGRLLSLQVGSGRAKNVTKPLQGHFAKANVEPKKILREFRITEDRELPVGGVFQADYFEKGHWVDITGITIGRGFAGAMKRHNFGGLRATHGVSVSHRSHGSTGHRKDPGKVFKGKKMAGHMGCQKVTVQNIKVMDFDVERGLIVVKGNVPGFEGNWVTMRDAVKKPPHPKSHFDGIVAPVSESGPVEAV
jgi:large subunit ribosomal protein L3